MAKKKPTTKGATKLIQIKCEGAINLALKELNHFQGDLKVLSDASYEKLKSTILELGFSEPISVWLHKEEYFILNGHQRLTTLKRMVDSEGYECPDIPCSIVEADDYRQAKKKVLSLTSEYGEISEGGLRNFLADVEIKQGDLDFINLKGVDHERVMMQVAEMKSDLGKEDSGNIDGYEPPPGPLDNGDSESEDVSGPRNDAMSGLRLLQIFLSDSELEDFKVKCKAIEEHFKTGNVTETIRLCVGKIYESITTNKA